jgi:predicted GIY-YIG superfamily endonuclease
MARTPRDTVTDDLKDGHRVVYRGTTDNPERREQEHQANGKKFTKMAITSVRVTEETAKAREAEALERYRRGHGGRNPRYNKDGDG